MKVVLLPHLPDPSRRSMDAYVERLEGNLVPVLAPSESLSHFCLLRWENAGGRARVGKLRRYYQQYVRYQRAVSHLEADVFHITDHGYAHLASSLPGHKVVVTFHDALLLRLGEGSLPVKWMPRRAVWAQKRCLQALSQVGHIVADSEAMRNELERFLPPPSPPISVVYLGIDSLCQSVHSSNSREQALKKFGLDHSVKLLVVGRSDPHKYLEGTLKIFARLLQWKVDAMLVKLGSDLTEEQKRLADRLGIGSRIRYLGTVLREELPAIYSSCNLLLHLSFYEGFGFPVLEAMACGLPVVASDIPVLREIAVDAAVFVDPLDEEAAAETVAAVLEERMDVASLIERGKCRAAEFTWEKTAQKTLEIYREVYERTKRK